MKLLVPASLLLALAACSPRRDPAELVRIGKMLDRGDAEGAARACREYVARHPKDDQGWVILAKVHDQQGREEEAVAAGRQIGRPRGPRIRL
jgi:predicted Zn-dependent protease